MNYNKPYFFTIFIFLLFCILGYSQNIEALKIYEGVDDRYREDQIYLSATFNVLNHLPEGVSQSGFSGGIHAGFIRDFPLNKQRNLAMGLGLGYSLNVYNHNLVASITNTKAISYQVLPDSDIKTNRFNVQLLEVPLQIRWRTSTAETYKFWRIYTGIRGGYVTRFKADFESKSGQRYKITNPKGLNNFRLGATLSIGWNTWNFHVYYSITDFFKKGILSAKDKENMAAIKLGLEFFIL